MLWHPERLVPPHSAPLSPTPAMILLTAHHRSVTVLLPPLTHPRTDLSVVAVCAQPNSNDGPPVLVGFKVPASVALIMLQDANVLGFTGIADPAILVGISLPATKANEMLQDAAVMSTYKQYLQ